MAESTAQPADDGTANAQFALEWDDDEQHFTITEEQLEGMLRAFADITAWAYGSATAAAAETALNIVTGDCLSQEAADLIFEQFRELADRTICEFQMSRDSETGSASIRLTIAHEDPGIPSPS